ncbi:AAA family ATPase [Aneurinibacillus aneurinilyticus]|uniref:McrB family protein n=1 Tax=Aneurinibacillus aneurinilyticus TaxID=1391 RepID=UPI0023F2A89F|nr:AAA family ATPase [Aneurinibacillus aneurinilyticus]MED0668756.1 AAA family ATPase [Aneurinibacillus aneurinilyticus]
MTEQLAKWVQAYLSDQEALEQAQRIDELRRAFLAHFGELEALRRKEITLLQFKKTLDHKTKSKHRIHGKKTNIWGFSGFSGQMFFNQIYNQAAYADMMVELTNAFLEAVEIPPDHIECESWTQDKLAGFVNVIRQTQKAALEKGYPPQKCASIKFATFFLSFFWGLQDLEHYPIYYKADREALAYFGYDSGGRDKPFDSSAYFRFTRCLQTLRDKSSQLTGKAWSVSEVQHFLFYVSHRLGETKAIETADTGNLRESRAAQRLIRLLREHNFIVSYAEEVESIPDDVPEEFRNKVIWRFAGTEGETTCAYVFVWDMPSEYICTVYEENEEGFLRKLYSIEAEDERTFLAKLHAHLLRKGDEWRQYTLGDAAADAYLEREILEEWLDVLHERKQMIIYGPPGTGKTYIAQRLARIMTQSERRICLVQFHPSYTYEEFIEGVRPEVIEDESGTAHMNVTVRPGIFLELCNEALKQENRDCAYTLIIDEMNRANTAKVFGELLYALEYRNSAVPLPYSKSKMVVPDNIYIIGTMNTTDRSLAQLDFALRRRFPAIYVSSCESERVLHKYLEVHHSDMAWVARLVRQVNDRIGNPDFFLGHSYFMNRSLNPQKLRRIWKYEIIPYLEEYFAYEPERVREFELDSLLEGEEDVGGD